MKTRSAHARRSRTHPQVKPEKNMTLTNHPLWFPLMESLGSFPHFPRAPARHLCFCCGLLNLLNLPTWSATFEYRSVPLGRSTESHQRPVGCRALPLHGARKITTATHHSASIATPMWKHRRECEFCTGGLDFKQVLQLQSGYTNIKG